MSRATTSLAQADPEPQAAADLTVPAALITHRDLEAAEKQEVRPPFAISLRP